MLFIPNQDLNNCNRDEIISLIHNKPHSFRYLPEKWKDDKIVVMELLYISPYNFHYISPRLKKDKTIVLHFITKCPHLFSSIDSTFHNDIDVALHTLETYPYNTKYISESLKNNVSVFTMLTEKNTWAINHMSSNLRNDPNVVINAIRINKNILSFLITELKFNTDFLISLLNESLVCIKDIPKQMLNNKKIMKCCIVKNYQNFLYISKTLYNDEKFIFELYLSNRRIGLFLKNTKHENVFDKYNFLLLLHWKKKKVHDDIFHFEDIYRSIFEYL